MVGAIRRLDPTRLVEDNSPCNYDHVEGSDLNSWHFYIDDHAGARAPHRRRRREDRSPAARSTSAPARTQATAPLINSEYGGVSAGSGDRDVSWCVPRPDHAPPPPAQDPGVRLHRADRHRVGAQRLLQLRPDAQGTSATTPSCPTCASTSCRGPTSSATTAPPAIVARPGETITVPVFVSHYSDRAFEPKLRWWARRDRRPGRFDHGARRRRAVPASWTAVRRDGAAADPRSGCPTGRSSARSA